MAFVNTQPRKTVISGKFNRFEFDTLMVQKGYPFIVNCKNDLVDDITVFPSYLNFSIDMDFFYQSKQTFECQYLITPNYGFSFESFMKFCAEYVDPDFSLNNKNKKP